jgi:hypothetical protein
MVHVRTLKMTDDVLGVRISPDGRLLAVSLLDSTVKVFYADTLKFFLSLYGHKVCCRTPFGLASEGKICSRLACVWVHSYRSFRSTYHPTRS